jgi:hypothetical protein
MKRYCRKPGCVSKQARRRRGRKKHTPKRATKPPIGMGRNIRPEMPGFRWCPSVKTIGYASKSR